MYLETYTADYTIGTDSKTLKTIEKLKDSIINYACAFENNDMDDIYFDADDVLTFNTLNSEAIVYIGINVIYPKQKVELCLRNTKKSKVLYIYIDFYELKYPDMTINKAVDFIRSYVNAIK